MLTPPPTAPDFIQRHVAASTAIISAARAEQASRGVSPRRGERSKDGNSPRKVRLVVVGGAGVMSRSWPLRWDGAARPAMVTETFPGSFVKTLLPIYGDFFRAHELNLDLLQSSNAVPWTMICPGFLREGGPSRVSGHVRLWFDVNDERLGGLSATYGDVAALLVQEVLHGESRGESRGAEGRGVGRRVGIESGGPFYLPSLVPSTLSVCRWQIARWLTPIEGRQ
mmetsp:Transcript_16747/g.38763  ORF Transcript_16747/g.38763 Transcript_16747/m.38763 type:complete len:225 (+) Transcript_16747:236-910(+)